MYIITSKLLKMALFCSLGSIDDAELRPYPPPRLPTPNSLCLIIWGGGSMTSSRRRG